MKKSALKIVILGHLNHGKSTLTGRLLLETNSLPKEVMAQVKKTSKEFGKDMQLSYLADQLREERRRDITIDTTQLFFRTRRRDYVIIDTPGHLEFIKNTFTGASLADAAVLIVDAGEGIMEQTRRHAYLLRLLGLHKVVVALNKMDLVDYKKEVFNKISAQILLHLKELGIRPFCTIPLSAKNGANISGKCRKMNWYNGMSLLEALDSFEPGKKNRADPLRLPVQDVYEVRGEKIIVGRVASGTIRQGQNVTLLPRLKDAQIKRIRVFDKNTPSAAKGENIGLVLKNPLAVKRGEVIARKPDLPRLTNRFEANIFWLAHTALQINKPITLRCATQQTECLAEKIEQRIDPSTLEITGLDAKELGRNEAATVRLKTKDALVVERFDFTEELGRFVLEKNGRVSAGGIITKKLY